MATARGIDHAKGLHELREANRYVRCATCNDSIAPLVAEIVEAAKKNYAPLPVIYEYVEKCAPGFHARVKYDSFRKHVCDHLKYSAVRARAGK